MHEFEEIAGEDQIIEMDMTLIFYLRDRDEPLNCLFAVQLGAAFVEARGVKDLMDLVTEFLVEEIDTKGNTRLVFSDTHHNRRIVMVEDIQSVSILAPDKMPSVED